MAVIERTVPIVNPLGLHARPAAEFVKVAGRFQSAVVVKRDGPSPDGSRPMEVNGKSIMGMMMLAAECGSSLHLAADGGDAVPLLDALEALIRAGFGEM